MTIRTILVPVSGSESDQPSFACALALARACKAHLDFYHLWIGPGEAAPYVPHASYVPGQAVSALLEDLRRRADASAVAARDNFERFCADNQLAIVERPDGELRVTASLRLESGVALPRLIRRARHRDLTVVGRSRHSRGLPHGLSETLLLETGRPIVVAPPRDPKPDIRTVLVCWKESREAAAALTAAMPLLTAAARVFLVQIGECDESRPGDLEEVASSLAWHGIAATGIERECRNRPIGAVISDAGQEVDADLIVMGGYGHSRSRELILGGATQSMLESCDRPVLLMH